MTDQPQAIMRLAYAFGLLIVASTARACPAGMLWSHDHGCLPEENPTTLEREHGSHWRLEGDTFRRLLGPVCLVLDDYDNIVGTTGPEECEDD